jgi:hypothetical protein
MAGRYEEQFTRFENVEIVTKDKQIRKMGICREEGQGL